MAKVARIGLGKFGFPSGAGCVAPSRLASEITQLSLTSSVLCGALAASLILNLVFSFIAVRRADATPYVADGGVFGCEVKSEAVSE